MRPAKFDGGASPLEFFMFEKGALSKPGRSSAARHQ
jgi:hypothetical protein